MQNNEIEIEVTTPNMENKFSLYALRHFAKNDTNKYLTLPTALQEIHRVNSSGCIQFTSQKLEDGTIEYSDPNHPNDKQYSVQLNPQTGSITIGDTADAHVLP